MLRPPAPRSRPVLLAAAFFTAALVHSTIAVAEDPPPPATQPATAPAIRPSDPEVHAKALQIIADALAKYRGAKSYQDKFTGRYEMVAKDAAGDDAGQSTDYAASLLWAGSNRLSLVTDSFSLVTDGKRLWTYLYMLDEYTESPAPETLNVEQIIADLPADDPPHAVLFVRNRADQSFEQLFPMVREFTAVTPEKRDDRAGVRLSGVFDATDTPFDYGGDLLPFSLWFDAKTGLLGEVRVDMTAMLKRALGLDEAGPEEEDDLQIPGFPRHITHAVVTARFDDVRLDFDVPTDRFVFQPPADAEKVERFTDLNEMPDPRELIGKPAPAFAGTALDEKPLSLEELRGRVVVLDFWATWCIPCIHAMPQLQKLHEQFRDKPVSVIGVNEDDKRTEARVQPFLKDKGITFRQLLDPKGRIARKYKVAGLPCTFLIDKKGTVQAVHLGLSMTMEEELSTAIEKLLKGENLFDPASLPGEAKGPDKP